MTDTVQPAAPIRTLAVKLAEVMGEVENVSKDGRNDFHRYDYATAENVLRALRKPLRERNVVLIPSLLGITEREFTTTNGKPSVLTTARIRFQFIDGDTGETIDCEWAGAGDDPADKGLYKAYTGAIRTFLRETFMLPQGDDPEADRSTDERAASRTNGRSSGSRGAVSADAPRQTEPLASARQRGLIMGKASDAALDSVQLATALLVAAGQQPKDFDNVDAATSFVQRNLDRLPARLVDPVLKQISASNGTSAVVA